MNERRLKPDFFFFFLQWIDNLFLGRWQRNLWKDHQNQLGDSSQYWLQMLEHTMNILDSLLLNRKVPPRNLCMPSVTWEEGVLRLLLVCTWLSTTEHLWFAFRKWTWLVLTGYGVTWELEVIKKVFVIGNFWGSWLMSFPHTYCVFETVLQVPCKMRRIIHHTIVRHAIKSFVIKLHINCPFLLNPW